MGSERILAVAKRGVRRGPREAPRAGATGVPEIKDPVLLLGPFLKKPIHPESRVERGRRENKVWRGWGGWEWRSELAHGCSYTPRDPLPLKPFFLSFCLFSQTGRVESENRNLHDQKACLCGWDGDTGGGAGPLLPCPDPGGPREPGIRGQCRGRPSSAGPGQSSKRARGAGW